MAEQIPLDLAEVTEIEERRAEADRRWNAAADEIEAATGNTGLADSIRHADPDWREQAKEAVRQLAATGRVFTVFEVTKPPYNVPDPPNNNAWGGITTAIRREELIEHVGWAESERGASKHSGLKTWRGTAKARQEAAA